ncbi:hypothetical protein CLAIMM_06932 [Cladophialophora immunda]|nr:hypothetical protein CLAIMM_06932 [Cladophialophora immunda]
MPNDCAERERLELQHCAMFLAAGAQLFYASFKRLQKILDLGAGIGTWANDVADAHLEAIVLGVDLSTIQPTVAPPNATWEIDDVEDDWTWPPDHFNLIQPVQAQWKHRRFPKVFSTGFQIRDLATYLQSDHAPISLDNAVDEWCRLMRQGIIGMGRRLDLNFEELGNLMREEEGLYQQYAMLEGVEALTLAVFTRCLGWEPERVQVFLADVRKRYTYWPCAVIYGKKPEAVYSQ